MLLPTSSSSTPSSPPSSSSPSPHLPSLTGVNGSPILTSSEQHLQFSLPFGGRQQKFSWDFVVGQVSFPILGADFLKAHRLLVDIAGSCLRQTDSGCMFAGQLAFSSHSAVAAALPAGVASLLDRFLTVVNKEQSLPPKGQQIFFKLRAKPKNLRLY